LLLSILLGLALAPPHPVTFGNDLDDLRSRKPPAALANCLFGALKDAGTPATLASHLGSYRVSDGRAFQVATDVARGEGTGLVLERRPDDASMARYRSLVSACL
jgi:hypothetical protein